jgi:signal transduction histidine kinase
VSPGWRARWERVLRGLPRVASTFGILLGLTVLLGWAVDSPVLTRVHPSLPPMVPLTAVCLILLSLSLGRLRARPSGASWARLVAAVVCAVGLLRLFDPVLGVLGSPASGPVFFATSPQTTLTFVLLGLALVFTGSSGPRGRALAPWLAVLALVPPLVAFTGHVFHAGPLYGPGRGIGMALHTLVGLVLLALGVLALEPERGPLRLLLSNAAGGVMARWMLPALLSPLVLGAVLVRLTAAGWLDPGLTLPLFCVAMTGALALTVGRNARRLNQLHAEQVKAEERALAEAERQRELARENARLYESAQSAARNREQVLAIVSHDLKNPLSAIRLSTRVLSKRIAGSPEEARLERQVAAIERAVASMLSLIHRLLDAARLDAGQALAISPRPDVLGSVVDEALALIEPQAAQKSLRLEQRLDAGLLALFDRERLLQVMGNLLGNAVKFTPEGGCIRVEGRRVGNQVRVSVEDTGPGIPESARARLFERHWQAEATASQGSGLGLYIARGIVEAHGGRIWVEGGPGRGSTFSFCLPEAPGASASLPGG